MGIILLARSEQELNGMLKIFKKYIGKKTLILSLQKSKVIVIEKGRRKAEKYKKQRIEVRRGE